MLSVSVTSPETSGLLPRPELSSLLLSHLIPVMRGQIVFYIFIFHVITQVPQKRVLPSWKYQRQLVSLEFIDNLGHLEKKIAIQNHEHVYV